LTGFSGDRTPLPAALVVDELDACFVIRDHNGQALSYTPPSIREGAKT
jgi:hypothetical protein